MNARKKLLLILSTQIATILMVVLHARVWKDFLKMLSLAMVRQALKKIVLHTQIILKILS